MQPDKRCRMLADKIDAILKNGIRLSDDALHYLDSTLSISSTNSLHTILERIDPDDIEPFYEFLFFPDEAMQSELEGLFSNTEFEFEFKKDDKDVVARLLSDRLIDIPIHLPECEEILHLQMPDRIISKFISRLKIDKSLDVRLGHAIDLYISEENKNRIRLIFRNSRFIQTENRVTFLCLLFEKLEDESLPCIEFMADLFEESEDNSDIYQTMMDRKQRYFQSIVKAANYEQMREQSNMETLLMQGIRIAHVDRADLEEKMKIIDRIGHAVFGKTVYFQKPEDVLAANEYPSTG